MNVDAKILEKCIKEYSLSAPDKKKRQKEKVFKKGVLADFSSEITNDWYIADLIDVTHLITCGVAKQPEYVDEGISFLSAQNCRPFKTNLNKIRFINNETFEKITISGKPEKDDILYTRVGNCGEAAKIPYEFDFGVYVSLTLIKPVRELLDSDYLVSFLNSRYGLMQAGQGAIGIGLKNLNVDNVRRYVIPLPPLAEQKQIATQLDQLLSQVNTLKNRLDNIPKILKRFRQSVLGAAVSGKLTEEWRDGCVLKPVNLSELYDCVASVRKKSGFRKPKNTGSELTDLPYKIPVEWSWARLGDLALKITDGAHNTPKVLEDGYPYLMAKDLTGGQLDFSQNRYISEKDHRELYNKCRPDVGDLLVVNIGAGTGNNVLIDTPNEFSFKNIAIIKRPDFLKSKYLKWYFDARKDIIFNEQTRGGAQPFLSLTMLNNLEIALPPIEEQTEIVQQVEKFFAFANQIEKQLNAAQTRINKLTQSILAKAFRGELTADWREQNPDLISGENSAEALLEKIKAEREKNQKNKPKRTTKKKIIKSKQSA